MTDAPDAQAQTKTPALRQRARAITVTSGLALGGLVLLGITGLASITLSYVGNVGGGAQNPLATLGDAPLEEKVVGLVIALKPAIVLVHTYGGYVTVLLSAWAALQCISFRNAAPPQSAHRQRARLVALLGGAGGMALALALLAQVTIGTFWRWGTQKMRASAATAAVSLAPDPAGDMVEQQVITFEGLHTRDLNLPVGVAAFALLAAMSLARSCAERETKKKPAQAEENKG